MNKWGWQNSNWADFKWNKVVVSAKLRTIHKKIGQLLGESRAALDAYEITLDVLLNNLIASSLIEDEKINIKSLKSSLARRLGVSEKQPVPLLERTEGLANILMDAVNNYDEPLNMECLLLWHNWLFGHKDVFDYTNIKNEEVMQVVDAYAWEK
ncbi:hypothetical protein D9M71_16910 [compost metagenome]